MTRAMEKLQEVKNAKREEEFVEARRDMTETAHALANGTPHVKKKGWREP
jgi:hypothetical protein